MSQTTRVLVLISLFTLPSPALAAKMPPAHVEPFEGIGHLLVLRFFDEAE